MTHKCKNQNSNHFIAKVRETLLRGGRMTKYKGQAASYAPNFANISFNRIISNNLDFSLGIKAGIARASAHLKASASIGAMAIAVIAPTILTLTVTDAQAACVEGASGVFTCSGANAGTIMLNANGGAVLDITVDNTFSLSTGSSIGLATTYYQGVPVTITQTGPGSITALRYGIYSRTSSGSTIITTGTIEATSLNSGLTTGSLASGITAWSGVGLNSITVSGDVIGPTGITAQGYGSYFGGVDDISITVNGSANVVGTNYSGVRGLSDYGYVNITVANDARVFGRGVDGQRGGGAVNAITFGSGNILVNNYGEVSSTVDPGLGITLNGNVNAVEKEGINAEARGANGGDITINSNIASGATDGIRATNSGLGAITITTTGATTGDTDNASGGVLGDPGLQGSGIVAINTAIATGDITINTGAGSTTGGDQGIDVRNLGAGAVAITTGTGAVTGDTDGDGTGDGIYATNSGTSLAITTGTGAITGGDDGIDARNSGTAGLTITVGGDVTGGSGSGINAYNSANDVTASMVINQAAGTTTTGAIDGIYANNLGGSLTINAYGTSVGTAGNGIRAINDVAGTTTSTLTVNNATGGTNGIYASNNATGLQSLTVTGTVTGGSEYGIRTTTGLGGMTTITLNAGAVVSSAAGLGIYNDAGDSTTTVNTGASVAGDISLGDGSDNLIFAGGDLSGVTLFDGGDDTGTADGFIDIFTLDGVTTTVNGGIITNWEVVNLDNSTITVAAGLVTSELNVTNSTATLDGATAPIVNLSGSTTTLTDLSGTTVNTCGGSTTIGGASTATDVLGCVSDDTIVIEGTTVIANAVEGAGGSDTISILGDASVAGGVFGGGNGQDASAAADAGNTITINTTGTVQLVEAGIGDDTVDLLAGTITTNVLGQGGADTITLGGATVTNAIDAGLGDDTFTWSSGTLNSFTGGDGSDTALVSATEFDGSQVLDGGDDTASADGFIDTLTLQGLSLALTGANITNWETVVIDSGTVSFTDNMLAVGIDAGTGLQLTNAAILDAGTTFALTGNLQIDAGATFQGFGAGAGVYTISGSLINNGTVTTQDGTVGDTVTVAGDYSGSGSLLIDTDFTTDSTDTLVVGGNITGGPTAISVADVSSGAPTGNDILVVDVAGTTTAGDFILAGGPITSGAFNYDLELQGTQFFLAGAVNATGATYTAVPAVLGAFNRLPTLEQRVGGRAKRAGQAAWVRLHGDNSEASLTNGSNYDSSTWGLQAGADFGFEPGENGRWVLGITGQYGSLSSTIIDPAGSGSVDTMGYGLGATATWYGNEGAYVDMQGQINWLDSDFASSTAGSLASGQSGTAYALSLEGGRRFALDNNQAIIPQAQVTWGSVDGGAFSDSAGNAVDLGTNNSTIGRVGIAYEFTNDDDDRKAYVIGNFLHDFSDDSSVSVAGINMSSTLTEKTWAEIGAGGTMSFDNGVQIYGEAAYRTALGGSRTGSDKGLSGTIGMRLKW